MSAPRQKLFVNCMNGLGDLVLVMPTITALARALPAEVTVLCWHFLIDAVQAYPCFTGCVPWDPTYQTDNGFRQFLLGITRLGPFAVSVDFAFPPRSTDITRQLDAPVKIAIRPDPGRDRGITLIERRAGHGVMQETFRVLDHFGIPHPDPFERPAWRYKEEDHALCRQILAGIDPGERLVVIHPGAGAAARRWPTERFASLADRLASEHGCQVLFLGGSLRQLGLNALNENVSEEDTVAAIRRRSRQRHFFAAGRDNTRVLALLLRRADYFIGNNSGPAHLAGQLGCRTTVLWGPAHPAEWSPVGREVLLAMNVDGLGCFPCGTNGCDQPVCMERLKVDDVLAAMNSRWPGLPKA